MAKFAKPAAPPVLPGAEHILSINSSTDLGTHLGLG